MFKTNPKSFFSEILIQYIWDGAQESALATSTLGFLLVFVLLFPCRIKNWEKKFWNILLEKCLNLKASLIRKIYASLLNTSKLIMSFSFFYFLF